MGGNGDREEKNERPVVAPAIAPTGPPSMLSQQRGPLESRMTVAVRQFLPGESERRWSEFRGVFSLQNPS